MSVTENRIDYILSEKTLIKVRQRIGDSKKSEAFIKGLKSLRSFEVIEKADNFYKHKLVQRGQQCKTATRLQKQTAQLLNTLYLLNKAAPAPDIQDSLGELVNRIGIEKDIDRLITELLGLYSKTSNVLDNQTSNQGRPQTHPDEQQLIRNIAFLFTVKSPDLEVDYEKGSLFHDLICICFEKEYARKIIMTALRLTDNPDEKEKIKKVKSKLQEKRTLRKQKETK